MTKDHNFTVIEGGNETPKTVEAKLTKEEIFANMNSIMEGARRATFPSFSGLVGQVIDAEVADGTLEKDARAHAVALTVKFYNEGLNQLGMDVAAVLVGEIEPPDYFDWKQAEELLGGWSNLTNQIGHLFFQYNEPSDDADEVLEMIGKMNSIITLLHHKVSMHLED